MKFSLLRNFTLLLCICCFNIAFSQGDPDVPVGDICDGEIQELVIQGPGNTQLQAGNSVITRQGQVFTAPAGIENVDGILIYYDRMTVGIVNLELYQGTPMQGGMSPDASEAIATAQIENTELFTIFVPADNRPVFFQFDTPISLTEGESYYFLVDPYPSGTGSTVFNTSGTNSLPGSPIDIRNGLFSVNASGTDHAFSFYDCSTIAPPSIEELPNLPKWGLITLSLFILGVGAILLYKRI